MTLLVVLRRAAWIACLMVAGFAGCRDAKHLIKSRNGSGVHYDTANEALLKSDRAPSIIDGWRPYVETLDEPVAIIDWQEGVSSTWEVFFGTNRRPTTTAQAAQARFGNEPLGVPQVGRAEVVLPRRRSTVAANGQITPVPQEEPQKPHFKQIRTLEWEAMVEGVKSQVARSRQHDLLLFVHGFNVDFESALFRTAQMSLSVPFNGAVVAYSWPSQVGRFGYRVDQTYRADEPINAASVEPFAEFLGALIAALPADTKINIVVHSMGNRLVMQAVSRLRMGERKPIANLVLCAPDVGLNDFRHWAPEVACRCERVTLYSSVSDAALIFSKGLNDEQRAGDAHPALILPGIETIDCSAVDFDLLGHSYYGDNQDVRSDLFSIIKEHRSADERPYLTRQAASSGGHWWRFTDYAPRLMWTWHFEETKVR